MSSSLIVIGKIIHGKWATHRASFPRTLLFVFKITITTLQLLRKLLQPKTQRTMLSNAHSFGAREAFNKI